MKRNLQQLFPAASAECPCQSGLRADACCWVGNQWVVAPAVSSTTTPSTGRRLDGCYAAELGDCSSSLSLEHYMSKNILQTMGIVEVEGLPWLQGVTKSLPAVNLATKMLCERHNHALCSLDTVGGRFYRAVDSVNSGLSTVNAVKADEFFLFNGHDLERFALKVFCGLLAGGNMKVNNAVVPNWKPDGKWLNLLYGVRKLWPKGWGMYFLHPDSLIGKEPGTTGHVQSFSGFALLPLSNGRGFLMALKGFPLLFAFYPPNQIKDQPFTKAIFRPRALRFTRWGIEKTIYLTWRGSHSNPITLNRTEDTGTNEVALYLGG